MACRVVSVTCSCGAFMYQVLLEHESPCKRKLLAMKEF